MNYTFEPFKQSDASSWSSLLTEIPNVSFLSSLKWISFVRSRGVEIDQFIIKKDSEHIGVLALEIHKRKIAKYAYAPYGPVLNWSSLSKQELNEFFKAFNLWGKNYLENKNLNILRFDPRLSGGEKEILAKAGMKKSFAPGQAIDIWLADIENKKQESLLQIQDKKTRYEIKKAKKKGVVISEAKSLKEVESFSELMNETMQRKGFTTHSSEYYKKQWEMLSESGFTKIWLATYKHKVVAGALMNYFKSEVSYTFGGSTSNPKLQKLSAPYFLHHTIMADAAEKGYTRYNFWGVVPKKVGAHAMRGLSEFKMKFNGELISFVGPHEIRRNNFSTLLQLISEWFIYAKERY